MITQCLLDLDGVITNFNKAFYKIHGVKECVYKDKNNLGNWHIHKLIGLEGTDHWKKLDYDFWVSLEWTEDGEQILYELEKKFKANNICLLTSPVLTKGCVDGKRDWIARHLPEYQSRYLIGSAKQFCASRNRLLVDDRDKNVTNFVMAGGEAILLPRLWNCNHYHANNSLGYLRQSLAKLE